ncbi:MAG: alpha/beta hydrolase, partial [Erysipelotrichaceae bacterium]|nr:alpha/beta hydrolase [Erysipelotrichaceae bacterium]
MIIKHPIWITPYETERLLHIYIPDNLKEGEKCPCLYMFDGHNLFFDEDATFGTSWGIKDYLDKHHIKLVVVGLECNHDGNERLSEFTPLTYLDDVYGPVEQKGLEL